MFFLYREIYKNLKFRNIEVIKVLVLDYNTKLAQFSKIH